MTFNVSIYDIISWLLTIVSVMLFIFERRKNSRLPYYMAVQGILRACKSKAGFYGTYANQVKSRNTGRNSSVSVEEHSLFAETVTSDFMSLMEHIMGSLKAIEPEKDLPFDPMEFTQSRRYDDALKQERS